MNKLALWPHPQSILQADTSLLSTCFNPIWSQISSSTKAEELVLCWSTYTFPNDGSPGSGSCCSDYGLSAFCRSWAERAYFSVCGGPGQDSIAKPRAAALVMGTVMLWPVWALVKNPLSYSRPDTLAIRKVLLHKAEEHHHQETL